MLIDRYLRKLDRAGAIIAVTAVDAKTKPDGMPNATMAAQAQAPRRNFDAFHLALNCVS